MSCLASQAWGSTSLSLAVAGKEATTAQLAAPPSKRWFLRPSAIGRIAFDGVVIELDAAVIEEPAKSGPPREIVDWLATRARLRASLR